MKKNKITPKYIIISLIILVFIIIAIFSFTLKEDRQLNKFESLIKDSVTSIEKIVTYPFRFVINKIDDCYYDKNINLYYLKYHELIL